MAIAYRKSDFPYRTGAAYGAAVHSTLTMLSTWTFNPVLGVGTLLAAASYLWGVPSGSAK